MPKKSTSTRLRERRAKRFVPTRPLVAPMTGTVAESVMRNDGRERRSSYSPNDA